MSDNDYLQQVMAKQQRVEVDLRARRASPGANGASAPARAYALPPAPPVMESLDRSALGGTVMAPCELAAPPRTAPVDVRITGWGPWKTVVVPPNAHVVHTRRGHARPLHLGLGVSFRYRPRTDSFLVVPGTMQTILIDAQCICKELQGLVVQGYVQWIIDDFATAYQKLDFTSEEDPMRVVNVSLREQAEAAIKDKVATMGIDEVLSDKQPIIEELTSRLRAVAEGDGDRDAGLGLRIVTVQIKEAVVSSTRVWESLQQPFRAERARIARLAALESEALIAARERVAERADQAARLAADAELGRLRAGADAEAFDRESAETARRAQREQAAARQAAQLRQEAALQAAELEQARLARETELSAARAQQAAADTERELALDELRAAARRRQDEHELRLAEARQRIANDTSPVHLQAQLVSALPAIAERLPRPTAQTTLAIGGAGGDGLAALLDQLAGLIGRLGARGA